MEIGVFIPIGNNGWLISSTSPQYTPSFDLNREVVLRAQRYGFDFALSMIKLRGFGGKSRYWDDNLKSFTLMAGLASITSRIELYATVAVLTMPPPLTARMAMTINSISHGRFGVNLVTGWQKAEYDQMGTPSGTGAGVVDDGNWNRLGGCSDSRSAFDQQLRLACRFCDLRRRGRPTAASDSCRFAAERSRTARPETRWRPEKSGFAIAAAGGAGFDVA